MRHLLPDILLSTTAIILLDLRLVRLAGIDPTLLIQLGLCASFLFQTIQN